ncbi:hypothetical protein JEQ12_002536 [Ovis aries]|uniref:Uncharacterized protein n=1 Tax=Ovis aries TaxID=9940 RepID=A0A836A696_SHEEP|nr:hypothetical protein JEQ12_002536 [Ovis aries]
MGGGAAGPKELGKVWRLADIHIYLCARQCEASPKVISGLCSWKRKAAPSSLKMEKPRNPLGGDHTNVAAPGSGSRQHPQTDSKARADSGPECVC